MIPEMNGKQYLASELAQAKMQVSDLMDERLKLLAQIAELEKALKAKADG